MSPINLTSAFLITQFLLLLIVYVGTLVLRAGEARLSPYSSNPRLATQFVPPLLVGFALITFAFLMFSDDLVLSSRPVFGNIELPSLGRPTAFLVVFLFNIFGASSLIFTTGGAKESPFNPVLFIQPALAIFLRESPTRFLTYTGLVGVLFLFLQYSSGTAVYIKENPKQQTTFIVVTLACLVLSTMVAYATHPV